MDLNYHFIKQYGQKFKYYGTSGFAQYLELDN